MNRKKENLSDEIVATRGHYIDAIRSIIPTDSTEAADIQDALTWLRTALHIYKPHNMERHLGVIFLVLSPDRQLTFMLNHKKAQIWLPPGGHVDQGLSFQDSVRHEMQEELQYEATLIHPDPFFLTNTVTNGLNAGHVDTTAWFLVEGNPNDHYHVLEKEASESRWMNLISLSTMPARSNLPRAVSKLHAMKLSALKS